MLKINSRLKIEKPFLEKVSDLIDKQDFSEIVNICWEYYKNNTKVNIKDIVSSGEKAFLYVEELNELDNSYGIVLLDENSNKWYCFKDTQYHGNLMVVCRTYPKEKYNTINPETTNCIIEFDENFLEKLIKLHKSNYNTTYTFKDNSKPRS